jgi:hypothetical protein
MRSHEPAVHEQGVTEGSFSRLLYRYFFFEWLFRDVNRGTLLERASAMRFNREMGRYLPVYLRRWIFIIASSCCAGALAEKAPLLNFAAAGFYFVGCCAVANALLIFRLWLGLKFE